MTSAFDLDYSITADQTWLTLEPETALSGTLTGGSPLDVQVSVNEAADSLGVGEHPVLVRFAWTDPANGDLSGRVDQKLTIVIDDPISVVQSFDPWVVGPELVAGSLPSQAYTLTNSGDLPTEVFISTDAEWLTVDPASVEILPGRGDDGYGLAGRRCADAVRRRVCGDGRF